VENGGLSVIIPTRDHQAVIGECLRSLFKQSLPPEEVLVVDRFSQDDTRLILREDYPSVKVVRVKRNMPLSRALNIGIRFTNRPMISVVFPSTKLDGKYFEALLSNMEKPENSDVGSATGKIYKMFRGSDVIDSSGLVAVDRLAPPKKRGEGEKGRETYNSVEMVFGAARAAAVYRRSLLDDVSLFGQAFDESLVEVLEDVDLAWRAHLQGWQCLYVPEAEAVYDIRDDRPGPTFPNTTNWEHDWRVVVLKNASSRALVKGLVRAVLGGAGSATRDSMGVISTLFALADVTSIWTELRCKRQEVQRRAVERALAARRSRALVAGTSP
jgi:GT2 family glycosyltransferase